MLNAHLRSFENSANDRLFVKRFFALFLAISAGVTPVWANVGDGDDKIEDSYGNVVQRHLRDNGTVDMLYHKERYLYFVVFDKRVSVLERYSRIDGSDLSEKEIARFLKANAGRKITWNPTNTGTSTERKFERSDHKAEATCAKFKGRLTLTVRALEREKSEVRDQTSAVREKK